MTWTAPITFVDDVPLTAAQLNTFLRDNMNETAPAKATTAGGIFVALGVNEIAERIPRTDRVGATDTIEDSSYTDGANLGPQVSVHTSSNAIVFHSCEFRPGADDIEMFASWEVSGATDISADDEWAVSISGLGNNTIANLANVHFIDNLTPGENVFTMKYKVESDSADMINRSMSVLPL